MEVSLFRDVIAGVKGGPLVFSQHSQHFLRAKGVVGALAAVAVGILGAVAHNLAQLCVAVALTNSAVLSYLPFLLLYALVTGSVTGSALRILLPALKNVTRLGL